MMMWGQAILRAFHHCLETMHGHCYVRVIKQKGLAMRDIVVLLVQLIISCQHIVFFHAVVQHGRTLCLSQ